MMPLEELIRDFQINVTDEPATEYAIHTLTDEEIKREFTIRFRKMMKDRWMTQKNCHS